MIYQSTPLNWIMWNSKELSKMNLWAVQIFKLFWVGLIRWDWWLRHVESDLIFVKMCISRRPILTCKKITNHKEIQIGEKRFFLSKKKRIVSANEKFSLAWQGKTSGNLFGPPSVTNWANEQLMNNYLFCPLLRFFNKTTRTTMQIFKCLVINN